MKPRRKKTEKQKWIARLDTLTSEYIRKRAIQRIGGCERCQTAKVDITKEDGSLFPAWKTLQWAHYRSKNKHSIRWDESNAAGLCGGCHRYIDDHAYQKVEFFRTLLGQEEFDRINLRAEVIMRSAATDYKAIEIYLKVKLNELVV